MTRIELGNQVVTAEFTADADIADEDVVALTGADAVSPADDTMVQEAVGIADGAAAIGEDVEVVIMGKKQVVADGAVAIGEPVIPAATGGRAASEAAQSTSHTHSSPSHSHNVQNHSHTMPNHGHTAFQTGGSDTAPGAHQAVADGGGNATAVQAAVDASGQAAESVPTSSDDPGDTNAGGPGSTDAADPGDTGSTDTSPENARALGMAVSAAGAAGETFTVLVGAKTG